MLKAFLLLAGVAALCAPLVWWGMDGAKAPIPVAQAQAKTACNPAGPLEAPVCVGCGDARHPTRRLNENEFRDLMRSYAAEPYGGGSALDALCYYGPQALFMLDAVGGCEVEPARADLLRRELKRDHVYFSVRVIDENGVERLTLKDSYTPFDANVHHHLSATKYVPPCEISGTIKRVGLHHIWARF